MTEGVSTRPTVLDATVLSNMAYLEKVQLLQELSRPVTTPAIQDEIAAGVTSYSYLENAQNAVADTIPVVTLDEPTTVLAEQFANRLDPGESEALALAESKDGLIVTDDGAARTLAREREIRFTGTIGVFIELIDTAIITESTADTWLKQLIDETAFRSPSADIADFL